MREDSSDYRRLFLSDTPFLDLRAPVEYARGAFPSAVNLPLLDDRQREQIGIRYKTEGQDEAIKLGLELATPEIREQRLADWIAFSETHPNGYLYCFRGGLRSRTAQQWLRERGIELPLVHGGYKAMRRFLIEQLDESAAEIALLCVGGLTGVGKTRALLKTRHHVDFEGLANHRGSAFGRDPGDLQPSSIDWENSVSIAMLKHRDLYPGRPLLIEDEGRCIGRVTLPEKLYSAMLAAPRAILEAGIEQRIGLIREDYIEQSWPRYRRLHGERAEEEFSRFVLDNLKRIEKRLGGERYQRVGACFRAALTELYSSGDAFGFDDGIRTLLEEYYDPMYRYQLESKKPKIVFAGPEAEFLQWSEEYCRR